MVSPLVVFPRSFVFEGESEARDHSHVPRPYHHLSKKTQGIGSFSKIGVWANEYLCLIFGTIKTTLK